MLSDFQHNIVWSVPWWLWQQCQDTNFMSPSTWWTILHLPASWWCHQPHSICKYNWECNVCMFYYAALWLSEFMYTYRFTLQDGSGATYYYNPCQAFHMYHCWNAHVSHRLIHYYVIRLPRARSHWKQWGFFGGGSKLGLGSAIARQSSTRPPPKIDVTYSVYIQTLVLHESIIW